jgi:hypothetical protein
VDTVPGNGSQFIAALQTITRRSPMPATGRGCVKTRAHQQIDDRFSGWLAASVYPVRRCARVACLKAFERRRAGNRESRRAQGPTNCIAFIVLAIPNTLITRLKL